MVATTLVGFQEGLRLPSERLQTKPAAPMLPPWVVDKPWAAFLWVRSYDSNERQDFYYLVQASNYPRNGGLPAEFSYQSTHDNHPRRFSKQEFVNDINEGFYCIVSWQQVKGRRRGALGTSSPELLGLPYAGHP